MALAQRHIKENHECVLLFTARTSLRQSLVLTKDFWLSKGEITRKENPCSSPYQVLSAMNARLGFGISELHRQGKQRGSELRNALPKSKGVVCCNNRSEKGHDTNALPERWRPAGEGRQGTPLLESRWRSVARGQSRMVPPLLRWCNVVLQQRRTGLIASNPQGARDSLKGSIKIEVESRTGPQVRSGGWGQGWGMKKQTTRCLSYSYCPYREILAENGQEVVEETKLSGWSVSVHTELPGFRSRGKNPQKRKDAEKWQSSENDT